jgi:biotin carboxylase
VFVESNTTGTGELFLQFAARNHTAFLLVADRGRYGFLQRTEARILDCDTRDMESLRQAVARIARTHRIEGIWSTSDFFIGNAIALARLHGLKLGSSSAVAAARNKSYQRRAFAAAGLGEVRSIACDRNGAAAAAELIGYPVVLKPLDGSGSMGVRLIGDEEALRRHVAELADRLLVEEYVEGQQFSLELFSLTPLGITAQHYGPPPTFIALGHDFPAPVSDQLAHRIVEEGTRAAKALQLTAGPVHVELRVQGSRVRIIEVNPRLAGGFIPELVRRARGIDLIAQTCAFASGRRLDLAPDREYHSSIRFILPSEGGVLEEIRFPKFSLPQDIGVETRSYVSPGTTIDLHGDFRDRTGHVMAWSPEPGLAAEIASLLQQHACIRMAPSVEKRLSPPSGTAILPAERK